MRFMEDHELSFCLTISSGIKRDDLLTILGVTEALSVPLGFEDSNELFRQVGKRGMLSVFEYGDFLVTVENSGYLGVTLRTLKKIAELGSGHYVACYDSGDTGRQFVEVEDGEIVANFEPMFDSAPDALAVFFSAPTQAREAMIRALEFRMDTTVQDSWLTDKTDTYVIDYRTDRD
jgi:hypothetical protein